MSAGAVLGPCHSCGGTVRAGEERTATVEQATGASPELLLHREFCAPPHVRRSLPRTH